VEQDIASWIDAMGNGISVTGIWSVDVW